MPSKLPPDFDPARYAAAYPDVALSGLDPANHYLLFGRLMGRDPSPARKIPAAGQPANKKPEAPAASPVEEPVRPPRPNPIIERPQGFDPSESVVQPAPPKRGGSKGERFKLAELGKGAPPAAVAYALMVRIEGPAGEPGLGQDVFVDGPAGIANLWLIAGTRLRLVFAEGFAQGAIIRAYQADAAEPEQLHLLKPGALLPKRGPVLVEFELRNRLMPVFLELSDAGDEAQALALLPFPSLLPGGLHGAELRALQPAANPVHGFWALSNLLLRDLLAGEPSLSGMAVATSDATPVIDSEFEQWLAALFGFKAEPEAKAGSRTLARADAAGAKLYLPTDSIPTVGALVARRSLGGGARRSTAPFLVAEAETLRPRWSVALPSDCDAGDRAPVLEDARQAKTAAPIHVAIAIRPPVAPAVSSGDEGTSPKKSRSGRKISVLLDASDAERTKIATAALKSAIGAGLDLAVRLNGDDAALRAAIDTALGPNSWRVLAGSRSLADAAAEARHDQLLTISDQIDLANPAILDGLAEMLKDKQIASASCVLLHEVSLKKQKVLQPATGGLFPAAVSFAVSPSLSFGEPDVLEALPDLTYPVVANTLKLTLWRTAALAGLSLPPPAEGAEDIAIGLALADQGFVSLCTTKFSARLNGSYVPRDAIDPLGQTRLGPRDWQELLARVTTLRQLF